MTTKQHNSILSAIFFVLGILQVFGWIVANGWAFGEWMFLCYGIFYVLTGFFMYNEKPAAKAFGIISSLLFLPAFPIGTAIGIYGMWYFIYVDNNRI